MHAILFDSPGDETVLQWRATSDPEPETTQVVIEAVSTSVNRADLLQRIGVYPPPPGASTILGLEVAGHIAEVGSEVTGWRVGQSCMALLPGGGYAERVAVDARHLMPVPEAVGLPQAGAVAEVFLTAYLNLIELGRLAASQRVLIHGGSGGVGTAAIQLANHWGAEVWTTAGGPERVARCRALGAHHGINYETEDFAQALREVGGAHLILDVMGAKYLQSNLDSLAPDGRLVIIGLQGGVQGQLNLGLALRRRLQIIASSLRTRPPDDKAGLIARFRERVWPRLDDGTMGPVIETRFPLSRAAEAHRLMAQGRPFGKILLITDSPH